MATHIIRILSLSLGLSALAACAEIAAPNTEPARIIPLDDYVGGLVTADLTINGETMPFIFDTGGGSTLVTPDFAERIGCTPWGRAVGHRMRGEAIEAQFCGPTEFAAGEVALNDTIGVFDLASLLPPEFPPVGGILALSSFSGQVVTLDLAARELIIESDSSLHERVGTAEGLPLRQQRELTGLALTPFVPIAADPGPLWFLVDSGQLGPIFLAPHAAAILENNELVSRSEDALAFNLQLGDVALPGTPALEVHILYDGVINAATLEVVVITFDFQNNRVWIMPR